MRDRTRQETQINNINDYRLEEPPRCELAEDQPTAKCLRTFGRSVELPDSKRIAAVFSINLGTNRSIIQQLT